MAAGPRRKGLKVRKRLRDKRIGRRAEGKGEVRSGAGGEKKDEKKNLQAVW
jgi:hypothetical protein